MEERIQGQKEMSERAQEQVRGQMQKSGAAGEGARSSGRTFHLLVDCVMVLILLTLYQKNAVSLLYHEVVGLVLGAAILVHLTLNRKWFPALFSGRIFRGGIRGIFSALISALMILCWCGVIVTGVLISKKLFPFHVNSLTPYHFFFASAGLILTGVHMGLHEAVFAGAVKKIPGIRSLRRPFTIILAAVVMIFGVYSFTSSGMTKWISAPFVTTGQHGGAAASGSAANDGGTNGSGTNGGAQESESAVSEECTVQSGTEASSGGAQNAERNFQSAGPAGLLKLAAEIFSMLFLVMQVTALIVRPRTQRRGTDPKKRNADFGSGKEISGSGEEMEKAGN